MAETNNKKTSLFREKNLERLESPEQLNDYLRVTSPGVWLVLATVIVLLVGVCIWGFLGRIEATTQAAVVTDGGESITVMDQVRDMHNTDDSWLECMALSDAMRALAPREKRILALRFYDGKTQMEVAEMVGISQAQVSRLEKGAVERIRKAVFTS